MAGAYDDSDDEELLIILQFADAEARTIRHIRDRSDPFNDYDDVDFRLRFRLPKQSLLIILNEIGHLLERHSRRNYPVSPVNQLLIALRFFAIGSFQARHFACVLF